MVYLPGGPSHIDMYDLKPNAPVEVRGEFKPIPTNVPGFDICELMPLQAKIADKFSMVRGLQSVDTHSAEMLMRGTLGGPVKRPVFGSVVSRMRGGTGAGGMPHYVALGGENGADSGDPSYLGAAHKPFGAGGGMANLSLVRGISTAQLADRKKLLQSFDSLNRELDSRSGDMAGLDTFHARALEMISSTRVRDAFDINKEPQQIRDKYGKNAARFLRARRLVEAGVSVVTLSAAGTMFPGGDWDTHAGGDQKSETNFGNLRRKLPEYDRAVYALLTDIYDRGLDRDVAVVVWGEFGRTPEDQQERRPGSLGTGRQCPHRRRRLEDGPGRRRHRPQGRARPQPQHPLYPAKRAGDALSPARHRPGNDLARFLRPADVSARRSGTDCRVGVSPKFRKTPRLNWGTIVEPRDKNRSLTEAARDKGIQTARHSRPAAAATKVRWQHPPRFP